MIICYGLRHEMKEERCLLVYSWTFMHRLSMQTPDCIFLWLPKMNTRAKAESIFALRGCHDSETEQHLAQARNVVINIHLQPESWKAKLYIQLHSVGIFPLWPVLVFGLIIIKGALMPFCFSDWNEEPGFIVPNAFVLCKQGHQRTFDRALFKLPYIK